MSYYLLIDTEYLARRAWHTTGGLKHKGSGTGIAYGVIREAYTLVGLFRPDGLAWCFDSKKSLRKKIYPKYKSNRIITNDRMAMIEEILKLRKKILPALGFRNVFVQSGYEADDLIGALAQDLHFADKATIVGSDKDLFQCLNNNTDFYNPVTKKVFTASDLKEQYGVHPSAWARVKAIAGCSSDCVQGVRGVGEKTAALWLNGKLEGKKKDLIDKKLKIVNRNMDLVSLPFKGCVTPQWTKEKLTRKRWNRVCKRLGITSIGYPGD